LASSLGTALCAWRWIIIQPRILILTDHHGSQVGAQLQVILQQGGGYQVGCLAGPLPQGTEGVAPRPDLLLPVLPAARERAEPLLATLRAQAACPPLMPVLQAVDLHQWPDGLHPWTTDFLVTPLREAEVRARVQQRLLQGLLARSDREVRPNTM
jgi:hypothetical protein